MVIKEQYKRLNISAGKMVSDITTQKQIEEVQLILNQY